jgi:hypothetical protein
MFLLLIGNQGLSPERGRQGSSEESLYESRV